MFVYEIVKPEPRRNCRNSAKQDRIVHTRELATATAILHPFGWTRSRSIDSHPLGPIELGPVSIDLLSINVECPDLRPQRSRLLGKTLPFFRAKRSVERKLFPNHRQSS